MKGETRHGGPVMAAVLLLGGAMSGCEVSADESQARLARLVADEERMDAALDAVEVRLLGNQARVHLWGELEWRHGRVSAIQCQVSDEHLKGMAEFLRRQEQKERLQRMASADTVLSAAFPQTREP